jgi:hypothetical protein
VNLASVKAHEEWYSQFLILIEAKKEAILEWRKRKAAMAAQAEKEMELEAAVSKESNEKKLELDNQLKEQKRLEILRWKV